MSKMTFTGGGDNNCEMTVHELLADFEFQRCRVNFYELRSIVARLIESIRYVRERKKKPLGCRLVNLT